MPRFAVAGHFGGRPGRGARYREDLRQEAIILARAGIQGGQSLGLLARELGIGSPTLARWLEEAGEALRPVEVRGEGHEEPGQASPLTLVAPSGWRIEGLHREDIPELVRIPAVGRPVPV